MNRLLSALLLALALLVAASPALAGSYLDRAALLLDQARKEGDLLHPRMHDKDLVALVVTMTDARSLAARKMEVPASIVKAHPHLLLVLAHYQSAADAASKADFKRFMEFLALARDEERTFRSLVAELGFALPALTPRR